MTTVIKQLNEHTGKPEYRSVGDSIKSADGNRVAGYLVRFTNADDPDLHGEYFTKSTNFWINEHPPIGKPIMLDHAFDPKFKSVPVGIIDFIKEDEIGLWIEGKLKERSDYEDMLRGWKDRKYISLSDSDIGKTAHGIEKAVKTFFSTGKAQWSSGALPQSVEVAEDGHITSWALIEGTGVYTPAEPDGTEIKLKSAFSVLDNILSSIPTDNATAHKEPIIEAKGATAEADNVERGDGNTHFDNDNKSHKGDTNMDENMIRQIVRMVLEENGKMDGEAVIEEDDLLKAVEEDMPEESKAEGETVDEEEVAKAVAKSALAIIDAQMAKRQKALDVARSVSRQHAKSAPVDNSAYLPSATGLKGSNVRPQISVGTARKFADLSGADMALGVKFLLSELSPTQQKRAKLNDLVSDEYARIMANKMAADIEAKAFTDPVAAMNLKSVLPFKSFKADELNASDISGQGSDWVTTYYDEQLWERVRDETQLFNLMQSRGMRMKDIPQGASSVQFQTDTSSGSVFLRNEANDLASNSPEITARISNFGTGNVTVQAKEHVLAYFVTDVLEEDSIIPTLRYANQDMITTLAEALEDAMINADTTTSNNINNDGASTTAAPQQELYLAWDGLRHQFLVDNTGYGTDHSGGALAATTFLNTRNLLPGRFRNRRQNLLYVIDYGTEAKARQLAELFTRDVAYNDATLFTGILPPIDGVELYTSGFLRAADSDGKITGAGNVADTGTIMCVYAPYWAYGRKRSVSIETARGTVGALAGGTTLVATVRHGFKARGAGSAAGTYNVAI